MEREPCTTSDVEDVSHATMRGGRSWASSTVRLERRQVKHPVENPAERDQAVDAGPRTSEQRNRRGGGRLRHPHGEVRQAAIRERDDIHTLAVCRQLALDLERLAVQCMPRILYRNAEFVGTTSWVPPVWARRTWRSAWR